MQAYLYTGAHEAEDVTRLAMSVAGLNLPVYMVTLGRPRHHPLAAYTGILPIDLVRLRLPGLGLPPGPDPVADLALQTTLATLRQVVASGQYRLIVLDGIREALARQVLDEMAVRSLVSAADEDTAVALA